MMKQTELTIVFPCLNERKRLRQTLTEYSDYFGNETSLVIVDNGSTDGTVEMIHQEFGHLSNLNLLRYDQPLGKGGAIYAGFNQSQSPILGFTDPDGSTSVTEFAKILEHINDFDCVIGSRWLKESHVPTPQPLSRRINGRAFNLFVRRLFNLNLADTQCGAKILTRESFNHIRPYLTLHGFAFDVELLWRLNQAGFQIKEVPITWSEQPGSRFSQFKSGPRAVRDLTSLRLNERGKSL